MDRNIERLLTPDWKITETIEEAKKHIVGFEFNGPGWYAYVEADYAMLVLPENCPEYWEDVLKQDWPTDTQFVFYGYNNRFPQFLIEEIGRLPIRNR